MIHHISLNRLKKWWHIKVVVVHNYEVGTMRVKGALFDFSLFFSGDAFRDLQIQDFSFCLAYLVAGSGSGFLNHLNSKRFVLPLA